MEVGPFRSIEGTRPFQAVKERLDFDLWRKTGGGTAYVLVRRFRMTANPQLEWVQYPPSEKVTTGFMVPLDYWDERVDGDGLLL